MTDWYAVLPPRVAGPQRAYDRYAAKWRFVRDQRAAGKPFREIGDMLGKSANLARNVWLSAQRNEGPSPLERYMKETSDLEELAFMIRRSERRRKAKK